MTAAFGRGSESAREVFPLNNPLTPNCTDLGQLTPPVFRRTFAPKGGRAMSQSPTKKPSAAVASDPEELERQIRQRAHELYEARGREDGHDLDDWLRAEEEITSKKIRAA